MAERTIVQIGDPVLRKSCRPIPSITPQVIKLLDDLVETIHADEGRAGLAAPQVGIAKRVAVIDQGQGLIELINPEIVERSGQRSGPEACLSIPGIYGMVNRSTYVKVKTWNRAGEVVYLEGRDDAAVCMQHEIDHLDGVLYLDHVQPGELFNDRTHKKVDLLYWTRLSWPDR